MKNALTKTVFISSTYEDLAEHRRVVWQILESFNVSVRGMEEFGARTAAPLETCLAELDQADVYVGIVGCRLGSLEKNSGKSFTQLEYEHALKHEKDILIYLVDESTATFHTRDIERDAVPREKLEAFKKTLRQTHTVASFSTPEDLGEKLRRDFARHFAARHNKNAGLDGEFKATIALVRRFLLQPKSVNGREVRLKAEFIDDPYPAARDVCRAFNLEYGNAIGCMIRVVAPSASEMEKFGDVFASGERATTELLSLARRHEPADILARLQFADVDVPRLRAEFFGYSYDPREDYDDPFEIVVAPEGRAILLFSRAAPSYAIVTE